MERPRTSGRNPGGTKQPEVTHDSHDHRHNRKDKRARHELSVKTPLLPRISGVTMESAQNYGCEADVEKRAFLDTSSSKHPNDSNWKREAYEQDTYEDLPHPKRRKMKWLALVSLFCLTAVAIHQSGPASRTVRDIVVGMTPDQDAPPDLYGMDDGGIWNDRRQTGDGDDTSDSATPLVPFTFKPLPLGSIQPLGWLLNEMQGMADGLAGNEMNFYPIISNSIWTGGSTDYSPLNEGYPYWFNGLVPLAYGLGNQALIGQVQNSISYVLAHQNATTGWIGPETVYDSNNLWGRFPLCLGLTQLAEADPSLAPEIVNALYKFVPLMYNLLADGKSDDEVWGRARYQDMIITLQWLYENYPSINNTDQTTLLMNTMYRLKNHGVDWEGYYSPQSYFFQDIDTIVPAIVDGDDYFPFLHGVNVGQGLKTMSVDYRFTNNASLLDTQRDAVDWTMQYHGAASGTIIGDERESGLAPNRGSELCTAVETMYSMEYIYAVTGVNEYADHAELAAFNALPVMLTADHWAHQYIAQPNGPWAAPVDGGAVFWNVGDLGITYGLAPNYPCCTVNHPQGYPKFASHTFMTSGDDGLAHVLLAPANVTTLLNNGASVNVAAITDYPFSDILTYRINTNNPFTFYVRVPGWASSPTLSLNGQSVAVAASATSGLTPIDIPAGHSTVQFVLTSSLRVVSRANDTIAVYHGPLLYALDVGTSNTSVSASSDITRNAPPTNDPAVQVALAYNSDQPLQPATVPPQARDYNISNTLPWNYAIDPSSLRWFATDVTPTPDSPGEAPNGTDIDLVNSETEASDASGGPPSLPNPIWDYHAPSAVIKGYACLVNWSLLGGTPFRPPLAGNRTCQGDPVAVELRPYGSLKVHMAELPTVDLNLNSTGQIVNISDEL